MSGPVCDMKIHVSIHVSWLPFKSTGNTSNPQFSTTSGVSQSGCRHQELCIYYWAGITILDDTTINSLQSTYWDKHTVPFSLCSLYPWVCSTDHMDQNDDFEVITVRQMFIARVLCTLFSIIHNRMNDVHCCMLCVVEEHLKLGPLLLPAPTPLARGD